MDKESLSNLSEAINFFVKERDWDKFHSPKNLVMALTGEVGELIEHFQWLTEDQSKSMSQTKLSEVEEELADVFIYLVRLADKLGINLIDAAFRKIKKNAIKYPIEKVRENSKKYTEYE